MQLYQRLPTRFRKRIASAYRAAAEDLHGSKAAHVHLSFNFVHEKPRGPTHDLHQECRVAKDFNLGRDIISPRLALTMSASVEQHLMEVSKSMIYINRVQTHRSLERDSLPTVLRQRNSIRKSTFVPLTRGDEERLDHRLTRLPGAEEKKRLHSFEKRIHATLELELALLDDSRRFLEQDRTLAYITLATIVFLPLSFVAGFISTEARGKWPKPHPWISVPLVLFLGLYMYASWDFLSQRGQKSSLVSAHISPSTPSNVMIQSVR